MSSSECYTRATEKLLALQELIEKGDKAAFSKLFDGGHDLRNWSSGDSYLQQYVTRVMSAALEKFLV